MVLRIRKRIWVLFLFLFSVSALASSVAGYSRKDWPHWLDEDGDCQDMRAEILIDASREPVRFRGKRSCVVESGVWIGVYTAKIYTEASDLHIDHLVPLKHAHDHGGAEWSRELKARFANDPRNLLPVHAGTNMQKGDKAPHQWRPPNRDFWCEYARRWQMVKEEYELRFEDAEIRALSEMSETCHDLVR